MTKDRKLSLNSLMRAIDQHDINWLAAQTEEERREFVPLVAMRMATGVRQDGMEAVYMLMVINRRVNRYLFAAGMSQHPDLMFRLLASCGLREGALQHTWIANARQAGPANRALDLLAELHPMASDRE